MNNFIKLTIVFSSVFFILVIVLSFSGALTFGHGLGDLVYTVSLIFWTLTIGAVYKFAKRRDFTSNKTFAILIFSVLLLSIYFTTRQFTVDRGSEFKWDGHILLSSAKADHREQQEKIFKISLHHLDSLTTANPKDFESYFKKGILWRHSGMWRKSIDEYEKAIKINPNYFEAYNECAYSYSSLENYKKAIELYQKASDIDTTNQKLKTIIKNLKEYHHLE